MDHTWRVVVRGQVTDEQLSDLPGDQMIWVSGHGSMGARSSTLWVRAPDATTAEEAVRKALSEASSLEPSAPFFVVLSAARLPYGVSVGVPEEDAAGLERVLSERRRETGSVGPLFASEPSDGLVELSLDADADSEQEAKENALAAYHELRAAADLPSVDPSYVEVYSPWQPDRKRHRLLLDRAQLLLETGAFSLAVVIAQAALEVLVKQVIEDRLRARRIGGLRAHINRYRASLQEQQTRKFWMELTNDEIGRDEAWKPYVEHIDRRNQLVHEAVEADEPGAIASLAAVRAMIGHIETLPRRREDDD